MRRSVQHYICIILFKFYSLNIDFLQLTIISQKSLIKLSFFTRTFMNVQSRNLHLRVNIKLWICLLRIGNHKKAFTHLVSILAALWFNTFQHISAVERFEEGKRESHIFSASLDVENFVIHYIGESMKSPTLIFSFIIYHARVVFIDTHFLHLEANLKTV